VYGTTKKSQIAKAILRKKNKAEDSMLPDFKVSYKDLAINTVWFGIKTGIKINRTEQRTQK